jgi:hypothetical protein
VRLEKRVLPENLHFDGSLERFETRRPAFGRLEITVQTEIDYNWSTLSVKSNSDDISPL